MKTPPATDSKASNKERNNISAANSERRCSGPLGQALARLYRSAVNEINSAGTATAKGISTHSSARTITANNAILGTTPTTSKTRVGRSFLFFMVLEQINTGYAQFQNCWQTML